MIYLASPYSHPDPAVREARFRAVCAAASVLVARGAEVFCPIAHSHTIATAGNLNPTWDAWRAADLRLLDACDEVVILCLRGWEQSVGIHAEVAHAEARGIRIRHLDLEDLLGGDRG